MQSTTGTASSTTSTSPPTLLEMQQARRKQLRRIVMDVGVSLVLLIPVIVCEFVIEPFRRGFFCRDESISYPFRDNTVTPVELGLIIALVPAVIIAVVILWSAHYRGQLREKFDFFGWRAPLWLGLGIRQLTYFSFGLSMTMISTELGKYIIGRLRPHFLAVCQPRFPDGSTCADAVNQYRYITDYVCVASGFSASDVRQARLSFPSGHSSLAFFAMVYVALYLQRNMRWRGSMLLRHALQFLLIMLAWFTALSRVMDYWHHWSDVVLGSAIGIFFACVTSRYVAHLPDSQKGAIRVPQALKIGGLPRQDTTTTLDEIIATPPPYVRETGIAVPPIATNGYTNEQYCV